MLIHCDCCGVEFDCSPSRYNKSKTHCCSKKCMNALMKEIRESKKDYFNCVCPVCDKKFHAKPTHKKRYKAICCSMECCKKLKSINFSGENNHQYGLKGELNASWKSDEKISSYGYRLIRCLDHPFRNKSDFVFEHRLVAEQYLLTEENSVEINRRKYLKKEYEVHHIDDNKLNNNPNNLMVVTKSEHRAIHNYLSPRQHDELGRFK